MERLANRLEDELQQREQELERRRNKVETDLEGLCTVSVAETVQKWWSRWWNFGVC